MDVNARNSEIVRLYEAGETGHEIGAKFDLSRERVYQIVRKAGVVLSPDEKRKRISQGVIRLQHGK